MPTMLATHMLDMLPMLAQAAPQGGPSDNTLVLWAVILLGVAMLLFVLEVFVPSGGLIGLGAAVSLILGIICLFGVSTTYGLIGATVALLALPFALAFSIKIWPNTPVGRALMLKDPGGRGAADEGEGEGEGEGETRAKLKPVLGPAVGDTGVTLTEMRPVGTCLINGKREECLAVGGAIDMGAAVRVVAVDGMHVKVREAVGDAQG